MGSAYVPNAPSWLETLIHDNLPGLASVAPRLAMPVADTGKRKRRASYIEYGCGHFGCVLPTATPGLVLKITSDLSEAMLVAKLIGIRQMPEGLVRYESVVMLNGKYRGRPTFAIWREEAHDVGFLLGKLPTEPYELRIQREFVNNLLAFRRHARIVFRYVDQADDPIAAVSRIRESKDRAWNLVRSGAAGRYVGPLRAAMSAIHCEDIALVMQNEPFAYQVGQALGQLLDEGMILSDVHLGNLGKVRRSEDDGREVVVITDPGVVAPTTEDWFKIAIVQV